MTSYVVGVDIGGTNLRVGLADSDGTIVDRWSRPLTDKDPESVVQLIRNGVEDLLRPASLSDSSLLALAAGAPGVTDVDSGIVIATSYLMGWRDVPLRTLLEAEFNIPVAIENDVNLAALGEYSAGAARSQPNFVFVAIGTGIGAGLFVNGALHRGDSWTAGEIGYMLVPGTPEAPIERGNPGGLEAIAGGQGIVTQWQSRWRKDLTSLGHDVSATEILDHALEGDGLANEILRLVARTLAYAIYNISLVMNSPLYIFGGSVGMHPAIVDATRRVLSERRMRVQPTLIQSQLGTDAQLVGAISLALQTAKISK